MLSITIKTGVRLAPRKRLRHNLDTAFRSDDPTGSIGLLWADTVLRPIKIRDICERQRNLISADFTRLCDFLFLEITSYSWPWQLLSIRFEKNSDDFNAQEQR